MGKSDRIESNICSFVYLFFCLVFMYRNQKSLKKPLISHLNNWMVSLNQACCFCFCADHIQDVVKTQLDSKKRVVVKIINKKLHLLLLLLLLFSNSRLTERTIGVWVKSKTKHTIKSFSELNSNLFKDQFDERERGVESSDSVRGR